MIYSIIIAGTGGQGVITAAAVFARAALHCGYTVRQSEVHGIAQRGGSVSAQVRIADTTIESDLVPKGAAQLIIGMEPLECLRFLPWRAPEGRVVTSIDPVDNFPGYPDYSHLLKILTAVPAVLQVPAGAVAREAGGVRAVNMVLLGAAAAMVPMLETGLLEAAIGDVLRDKGEGAIASNLAAFRAGAVFAQRQVHLPQGERC